MEQSNVSKKTNPAIIIILVVIIIALVGVVVYLSVKKDDKNQNANVVALTNSTNTVATTNQNPSLANANTTIRTNAAVNTNVTTNVNVTNTNSTTAVNTNTATDETKDWKTYRNEELSLEFKYPQEWGEARIEMRDCDNGGKKFSGYFDGKRTVNWYQIEFAGFRRDCSQGEPRSLSPMFFYHFVPLGGSKYQVTPLPGSTKTFEYNAEAIMGVKSGIQAIALGQGLDEMVFYPNDQAVYVNIGDNSALYPGVAFNYSDYLTQDQEEQDIFFRVIKTISVIR